MRQGLGPGINGRADRGQARQEDPAVLPHPHLPRPKTERKGFVEADYAALLRAAHHELHAPIVVVWDGLNTHTSTVMRQFIDSHDWLTVVRLPAYAPELNPTEGVWAHVKRDLGNLAARGVDPLAATVKTLLKRLQYRPALIDSFIAETGLTIEPEAP